jgi:superoxide dismutase, Cu-Zn family
MTLTRRVSVVVGLGAVVALVLIALTSATSPASGDRRGAAARLVDAGGNHVATVRFEPGPGGTTVGHVRLRGAAPGFHGFHVHAVGECVAPFTSAGGHFNPAGATHGNHAGDMPPLLVGGDGAAEATFTTDRFTVADLMDADGSAVIVHAGPDNLANIPTRYHSHTYDVLGPDQDTLATGDAGSRFACGVVE